MASHQKPSSSNSSNSNSTQNTYKYDVFLSFRGEDTRNSFTDHLYHALTRSSFKVFRDDEELERGEVISKELLKAIEDSRFAIVVLSQNYASSSWCLNELRHILYSRDNLGQQVFPIFYHVDPSDVRHQRGIFGKAFDRHRMLQRDNDDMKSWRDSLTKVASLSGWHYKDDRAEAKLIDTVVQEMWPKLCLKLPPNTEDLIGIDNKVEQVEPLLEIGSNDVRFIGIWGLGGVGKTTVAWTIFEKYLSQFDISCFLHNVRATSERDGVIHLQNQLLSHLNIRKVENTLEGKKIIQNRFRNRRVLLILDDVSQTSHLENLANSPNWFGAGSRVIITTINLDLLSRVPKEYVHEVKIMNQDESLQLFRQKASGRTELEEDLLELSKAICDYAGGLPLALSVLGSYFCGRRSVSEWEDALDMLKENQDDHIFTKLKISFEGLTAKEQTIFLDIACFFNGQRRKKITQILESCGFKAKIGITTLQEKSMVKDYGDLLVMHDLLEQMGRRIVVDQSFNYVGNQSRLWSKEGIDKVLGNKLGTEKIEGMVSSTYSEARLDPEAFSTLHNLRLLIVSSSDRNLHDGLKRLSHALKVLHWTNFPLDTLPSGTRLDELVDLKMRHSKLKKLWNKSLCSERLKFMDLSYSKNLIETPDFSELPNLERLELEGCEGLFQLHASIGQHKKLQVLNLKGCKNLREGRCPRILEMTALKEFVLLGCIQIKYFPEFGEMMKNLETLDARETGLVKLPESLGLLSGLKALKLRGCKNLVCLPQSIRKLKRLALLDIAMCSKFSRLPEKLNEIEALEELDASETFIREVPCSIGGLEKLQKLSLGGCKSSTSNSWRLILPLKHTFWGHSIHNGLTLPASIYNLKSLKELDLSYCGFDDRSIPEDLGGLTSLESLDLSGNKFKKLPAGCISNLSNLRRLWFNFCSELGSLPQPPPYLREMTARECGSLGIVGGEQLADRLASKEVIWSRLEKLSITIPGNEIPSWFENQNDVHLQNCEKYDKRLVGAVKIEASHWEEMLGMWLCIVLDDRFYSSDSYKVPLRMALVQLYGVDQDLGEIALAWWTEYDSSFYKGETKYNQRDHLWIMFWNLREGLSYRPDSLKCCSQVFLKIDVVVYFPDMISKEAKFAPISADGMSCAKLIQRVKVFFQVVRAELLIIKSWVPSPGMTKFYIFRLNLDFKRCVWICISHFGLYNILIRSFIIPTF